MSVLSPPDYELLVDVVEKRNDAVRPLVDELNGGQPRLSADEGDMLRSLVGDGLVQTGFGPDYVPNARGYALERLIDVLGVVTAIFD
jgi:hypothetical protein